MKYENIIVTIYIKSIDQYDFVYYSEYLITVYFINALLYPYTIQYNIFIPIRVPQGAITNIHS
jgi:hypothetical protein